MVLPYLVDKEILGMRLIPPRVKEERDRRPRWIGDYSFSNLGYETLPIAAISAMKYGWALDRLSREVVIAYPELGLVNVLKADVSDGFYHIGLYPTDTHKIGIVFTS